VELYHLGVVLKQLGAVELFVLVPDVHLRAAEVRQLGQRVVRKEQAHYWVHHTL